MYMNLIKVAHGFAPGWPRGLAELTEDEIELYFAYMQGEVTAYQCRMALGRSYGYYTNWCRRAAIQLFKENKLFLEINKAKTHFVKPTYEKQQQVYKLTK